MTDLFKQYLSDNYEKAEIHIKTTIYQTVVYI